MAGRTRRGKSGGDTRRPQIVSDELSLEDLDKVVGGNAPVVRKEDENQEPTIIPGPVEFSSNYELGSQNLENTENWDSHENWEMGSAHQPRINQYVAHIASQVAGGDPSQLNAAGQNIANAISNGHVTAQNAFFTVCDAFNNSTLGGEQAMGLLAHIRAETRADDWVTRQDFHNTVAGLINDGRIGAQQAVAALALAGDDAASQKVAAEDICHLMHGHALSAGQVVAGVGAAVDSHALTGGQGLGLLVQLAAADRFQAGFKQAIAPEIASMIADNQITPAQVAALLHDATDVAKGRILTPADAFGIYAGIADRVDAMQPLFAAEVVQFVASGAIGIDIVRSGVLPPDVAVIALAYLVASGGPAGYQAIGEINDLISRNAIDAAQAMAEIRGAVFSHVLTAEQAFRALTVLASSADAAVGPAAGVLLGSLVSQGQLTADRAIDYIHDAAKSIRQFADPISALTHLAANGNARLQSAVTAEFAALIAENRYPAGHIAEAMAAQLGGGEAVEAVVVGQLAEMIAANQMTANQAVAALAGAATPGASAALYAGVCGAIAAVISLGGISAPQAMAEIGGGRQPDCIILLAAMAGFGDPHLYGAAAQQINAMSVHLRGVQSSSGLNEAVHWVVSAVNAGLLTPEQAAGIFTFGSLDWTAIAQLLGLQDTDGAIRNMFGPKT